MNVEPSAAEVRPKEALLRFYEAEANFMKAFQENGAASFDEMRETLASDVVLHQSPDLPFGGDFVGFEGYERWAIKMGSIFDKLEVTNREFFEQSDNVIVVCRFITRSRINGSVSGLSHGAGRDLSEWKDRRFSTFLLERSRVCGCRCTRAPDNS